MTAPRHPRVHLDTPRTASLRALACAVGLVVATGGARADSPHGTGPDASAPKTSRLSTEFSSDLLARAGGAVPERSLSAQDAPPAPPPTLLRGEDLGQSSKLGAWVTLGSGVAAVVVGGVLYGLSAGKADAANRASLGGDRSAYERHLDAYELERGFSWGLLSVGTAAVGVGALMLLLDDDAPVEVPTVKAAPVTTDEPSALDVDIRSVHVRPLRRGGLLSMRGRF